MAPDDRDRALDELVILYVADRDQGITRTEAEYRELFPSLRGVLAEELKSLEQRCSGTPPSSESTRDAVPRPGGLVLGGRYRVERELGRGGHGSVFLAYDTTLGRRVAVKVMRASWSGSSTAVRRFERETRALARLDHPGLATIHDSGSAQGLEWFVMPFVEGRTLAEEIAARGSDVPLASAELARFVEIVEKAARSLHAAHEAGLVHRDVKPANLMIRPEGDPLVLDFGVAALAESRDERLTATGDVLGTPGFMAPEQIAGQHRRIDRRTDVWALGATLRWAVSLGGRAPARLPRRIEAVLAVATDPDPDRRYATADALADDLARARLGLPLAIRPPGPVRKLFLWFRRAPAAAALATLPPLALVAGAVMLEQKNAQIRGAAAALARQEMDESETARRAAARFADWRRLDDLRRVEDLAAREAALGPPLPDRAPVIEKWLADAGEVVGRLPEHRAALEALRRHGRAAVLREPGIDPVIDEILACERVRDAAVLDLREPTTTGGRREYLQRVIDEATARLAHHERAAASRPSWRYDHVEDQWLDDNLSGLVANVSALDGPAEHGPTLASMRRRLEVAKDLEKRSIADHAAAWREAVAAIANPAASPAYGGLRIEPVLGLVPLGRDPASKLWEFAHLLSGSPPVRNAAGALEVSAASSIVLVLVPGGRARIGARAPLDDDDAGDHVDPLAQPHESPVHEVGIDAFFISKHEMTQGQWLRATGSNPSFARSDREFEHGYRPDLRHPVEQVSFDDCVTVLSRLGLVLPTEVQWEWAARAGTTTPWWPGATIQSFLATENLADAAWIRSEKSSSPHDAERDDGWAGTAPVGSYPANPWGLHDVVGNVSEWCRDRIAFYGVPALPGDGLRAGGRDDGRAIRGGSCTVPAERARASHRSGMGSTTRAGSLGVRPVMPLRTP